MMANSNLNKQMPYMNFNTFNKNKIKAPNSHNNNEELIYLEGNDVLSWNVR